MILLSITEPTQTQWHKTTTIIYYHQLGSAGHVSLAGWGQGYQKIRVAGGWTNWGFSDIHLSLSVSLSMVSPHNLSSMVASEEPDFLHSHPELHRICPKTEREATSPLTTQRQRQHSIPSATCYSLESSHISSRQGIRFPSWQKESQRVCERVLKPPRQVWGRR